jgi:hypothetical protein
MQRTLFLSSMHKFRETSPYFTEWHDAIGHIGMTPLQKCIVVLRQLAYGMTAYTIDEYLKLVKTTIYSVYIIIVRASLSILVLRTASYNPNLDTTIFPLVTNRWETKYPVPDMVPPLLAEGEGPPT